MERNRFAGKTPEEMRAISEEESSVCKGFHPRLKSRYTPPPNFRAMTRTDVGLVSGTVYSPKTLPDRLFNELSSLMKEMAEKLRRV
jgi:hypothetical protein